MRLNTFVRQQRKPWMRLKREKKSTTVKKQTTVDDDDNDIKGVNDDGVSLSSAAMSTTKDASK